MQYPKDLTDYQILDTGDGEKLERFCDYYLIRPDPQVIWPKQKPQLWDNVHAKFSASKSGGGEWEVYQPIAKNFVYKYCDLKFNLGLKGFKHTGIFPEQAYNWRFIKEQVKKHGKNFKMLNLFAYTGGATLACASAGGSVVHVDAAKGMNEIAKQNAVSSGLRDAPIRYIVDDCAKFVQREINRKNTYQGIIMDPPSYGRGPNGQLWKIEDKVFDLVQLSCKLLSKDCRFFIINSYTTGLQPTVMENILRLNVNRKGKIISDELGIKYSDLILPCGCFARFQTD